MSLIPINCVNKYLKKTSFGVTSDMGDISWFWPLCLKPLVFLFLKILELFGFWYFGFECTWWRLFKKRVVHTFDIDLRFLVQCHLTDFTSVLQNVVICNHMFNTIRLLGIKKKKLPFWRLFKMWEITIVKSGGNH